MWDLAFLLSTVASIYGVINHKTEWGRRVLIVGLAGMGLMHVVGGLLRELEILNAFVEGVTDGVQDASEGATPDG